MNSVRVEVKKKEGEMERLVMVEMQGTVETRAGFPPQSLIGTVSQNEGSKPILQVGRSKLDGAIVKLGNPMLLLHKLPSSGSANTTTTYEVIGVLHEKLLFKNRPQT